MSRQINAKTLAKTSKFAEMRRLGVPDAGNSEHISKIIEEAVKQANTLARAEAQDKAVFPVILKWVAGIAAVLVGAAVIAYFNWLTGSVNQMQVTLARMDERQSGQIAAADDRYKDMDRRVTRLEAMVNK